MQNIFLIVAAAFVVFTCGLLAGYMLRALHGTLRSGISSQVQSSPRVLAMAP